MLKNILKKEISYTFDNKLVYFLIVTNIALQVASFILVKIAAVKADGYITIFFNLYYIVALSFLIIRSIVWQLILKNKDISLVYPLNAVVPVFILLSSVVIFNESISNYNMVGTLIIMIGILLLVKER